MLSSAPSTDASPPGQEPWWRSVVGTVWALASRRPVAQGQNRRNYTHATWRVGVDSQLLPRDVACINSDWRLTWSRTITRGSEQSGSIGEVSGEVELIQCTLLRVSRVRVD